MPCVICHEEINGEIVEERFCELCDINFHIKCLKEWLLFQKNKMKIVCPGCRDENIKHWALGTTMFPIVLTSGSEESDSDESGSEEGGSVREVIDLTVESESGGSESGESDSGESDSDDEEEEEEE